jgi:16S rRNA processing protein RimM
MSQDNYVVLARVMRTHGLKGEVSVAPATEAPLSSVLGQLVWFVPPPAVRSARLLSIRRGPKGQLVTFEGIDDIGTAQTLVGCDVLVDEGALPRGWQVTQEPGHEGYHVTDEVHGELGLVTETIVTGANDVWVVQGRYGEILIPVIDDVVIDVDDTGRTLKVRLLPGLMPEGGTGT